MQKRDTRHLPCIPFFVGGGGEIYFVLRCKSVSKLLAPTLTTPHATALNAIIAVHAAFSFAAKGPELTSRSTK